MEMTVCTTETNDEQVGVVLITQYLEVWHLNLVDFCLTQTSHEVVILWVGGDGTCLVVLLQSTEDMLETFATWHCPIANTSLLIAEIRSP